MYVDYNAYRSCQNHINEKKKQFTYISYRKSLVNFFDQN